MTNIEKVKVIREKTFSPINRINAALTKANGDVDAAIAILGQPLDYHIEWHKDSTNVNSVDSPR